MKTLKLISILLLAVTIAPGVFAQSDYMEEFFLPVVGLITEEGSKAKKANLLLYEGNEIREEGLTARNGTFYLELDYDRYYTLEIVKPGYISKLISFDTHVPRRKESKAYQCYLNLLSEEQFVGVDISDLDFPAALVSYDDNKRKFTHNPLYLENNKNVLANLMNMAEDLNFTNVELE